MIVPSTQPFATVATTANDSSSVSKASNTTSTDDKSDATNDQTSSPFAATLAAMFAPHHPTLDNAPQLSPASVDSELSLPSSSRTESHSPTQSTFADALAVQESANKTPVTEVNNDVTALNPEFRARLERVRNRMQDEFGYTVDIVEGFRPQARQNFLYEQGRTRPGEVVTWTKSSKHTAGLAADLLINGTYNNPAAYQQLAQIAAQEGLRTLGPRDAGHVELPSRNGSEAWGESKMLLSDDTHVSRAIELAFGKPASDTNTSANTFTNTFTNTFNALLSQSQRTSSEAMMVARAAQPAQPPALPTSNTTPIRTSKSADVAQVASVADVAHVATVAPVIAPNAPGNVMNASTFVPPSPVSVPLFSNGTDAVARLEHLLDARDASPTPPLSHITLALDNDGGGTDHVRVDVRGASVDTHITLDNQVHAERMSLRVGELQRALEHRGLDAESVHITTAGQLITRGTSAATDTGAGWTPRQQTSHHRDSLRQDAGGPQHRSQRNKERKHK